MTCSTGQLRQTCEFNGGTYLGDNTTCTATCNLAVWGLNTAVAFEPTDGFKPVQFVVANPSNPYLPPVAGSGAPPTLTVPVVSGGKVYKPTNGYLVGPAPQITNGQNYLVTVGAPDTYGRTCSPSAQWTTPPGVPVPPANLAASTSGGLTARRRNTSTST